MSTQTDHIEFYNKLDETGEEIVRVNIAKNIYAKNTPLAETWLQKLQDEKTASFENETLDVAKSANELAGKALASNRRSEIAAWIAAIAAVIAVIAAFLK